MKTTSTTTSSCRIDLGTVLTIIFVVLKLLGVISWSWVWVLSPLWISVALAIIIFIISMIVILR